jgi:hypothetical protein
MPFPFTPRKRSHPVLFDLDSAGSGEMVKLFSTWVIRAVACFLSWCWVALREFQRGSEEEEEDGLYCEVTELHTPNQAVSNGGGGGGWIGGTWWRYAASRRAREV